MKFEYLCRRYGLGDFKRIAPVKPGTGARVWRLDTNRGTFLVRTLAGKSQGEMEWTIYRHLLGRGFCSTPAILTAGDGAPFVEQDKTWYQVQKFLPGERPDPAGPGAAGAIARMVKVLAGALADCPPIEAADRFDLAEAWKRGRKFWPLLETPFSAEQAEREVARCGAIPSRGRQVIHGDLGPWNMIDTGGGIFVIDFGEARMGDPCFDYASALGGIINHTPSESRAAVCREFLDELCGDRQRLLEQLRLWVWRGLAQWAILAGQGVPGAGMAARFCGALKWAEENLYEL